MQQALVHWYCIKPILFQVMMLRFHLKQWLPASLDELDWTYRLSPHRLAAPISLGPRLSTGLGTWAQELLQWTLALRKAPEPCWSTAALHRWTAPRAHLHHRGDTSKYTVEKKQQFNSLCPITWSDCSALNGVMMVRETSELLYCTLPNKSWICRQLRKKMHYLESKTHPNTQCQCDLLPP